MKATTICRTCGCELPPHSSPVTSLCPACLLRASCTPDPAERGTATTWAEVFPQLEVVKTIREVDGLAIYLAQTLEEAEGEWAILQVASGERLKRAGGAAALAARVQRIMAAGINGLAPVLDFGDLADAFFLVTEAPGWPRLPEAAAGRETEELSLLFAMASEAVDEVVAAAREAEIDLRFEPALCFVDEDCGQALQTPTLLPAGGESARPAAAWWTLEAGGTLAGLRLEERIGEGGFGEVWRARQENPVERSVAVKVLKHGLHSQRARARFEVEQRSLARLDHPHIARFFDGGTAPDERPYFVMEWVDGQSLTRHCDRTSATLPERLRLFSQVGEAVHHAHQKGIIHRDLKPSNVMVTANGGPAAVKVIDFGIARTFEDPEIDCTRLTRAHEILGTPASMSPEQADGAGESELDARTDVYGLGVLLYELLTGNLPFDPKLPADELHRRIRDEDPPKPSRCADSKEKARRLRGDLDWITMRCLEKDPTRRYASVSALLRDLERHANDEPVEAGPPELGYRVTKFMRRNRTLVGAAGAVCLALVVGLLVAVAGYGEAKASEQEAREAESLAEERLAEERAAFTFLSKLLFGETSEKHTTYDQLLERAVDQLDRDAFPNPERWMELQGNIAVLFENRGDKERAISLFEEIEEYRTKHGLPPDGSCAFLPLCYHGVGRHEEGLKLSKKFYTYWRDHEDRCPSALLLATQQFLTSLYFAKQRDEASTIADEAWRQFNALDAIEPRLCKNLAICFRDLEQYDRSIAVSRRAVEERTRALGSADPVTLLEKQRLAQVCQIAGHYRSAAEGYREILRVVEELPGAEELVKNPTFGALSPAHIGFCLRTARANLPLELLSEGQAFLASGEKELARERFLLGLIWGLSTNPSSCVTDPPWRSLEDLLLGLDQCDDEAPRGSSLIDAASTWAAYCGVGEDAEAEPGWNQPGFDAASWQEARAPLGYGDETLTSEIWEVRTGEPKPTTVYVRKEFEVSDPDSEGLLVARVRADDGVALYLNGAEVARLRLPDGPLLGETFATGGVGGDSEAWFRRVVIDRALLKEGTNLLAAEVHQVDADSSDVIFDLELLWAPQPAELATDLAGFDPGPVIERIRQEGKGAMPSLPPFAPTLAAAQVLALNGEWEAALQMTEPMIEQVEQGSEVARIVSRFRSHGLKALGRPDEAQKALVAGLPERSKEALPTHLDLTHHYTAYLDESLFGEGHPDPRHLNQLRLPAADLQGVIEAGPHTFEVRGVVHLNKRGHMLDLPGEVRGIEVNACAKTVHFLHALHDQESRKEKPDEEWTTASYVITYADGTTVEIPVRSQDHDINCSDLLTETAERLYPDGGFIPTWKGPPVAAFFSGYTVLYVKSWTNPRPEVPVRSIDVISSNDPEAPALMLFGITTEPVPGPNGEAQ